MEEDEELGDWDDAFEWESEGEEEEAISAPPPLQIKGREADVNAVEEKWDSDFEFGSDSSEVEEKIDLATSMATGLVLQNKGKAGATSPASKASVTQEWDSSGSGGLSVRKTSDADLPISVSEISAAGPAGSLINVLRETLALIPAPPSNSRRKSIQPPVANLDRGKRIDWEEEFRKKDARVAEAQGKRDKIAEIRAYQDLATLYKSEGEQKKAINQLTIAHKLLKDLREGERDSRLEAEILVALGELSNALNDFLQAEDYLQAALELATDKGYYPLLATINYQLGCTSVTSDLPIRAGTYFCSHLGALLYKYKNKDDTEKKGKQEVQPTESLPWPEIGKSCFELGKLLGNLEQKEMAVKFLNIAVNSLDGEQYAEAKSLLSEMDELSGDADGEEPELGESSESEWSDWEVDVPAEGGFGFTLAGMTENEPKEEEKSLPSRYKLLDDEQNIQYEIQKFPKPTVLYSIATEQMHENRLIDFLTNIVTKRPLIHEEKLFSAVSVEEQIASFSKTVSNYPKFTGTWANLYLDFCQTTYMNKKYDECWRELVSFFEAYNKHTKGDLQLGEEMTFILQMIHLAAKIWTPERDKSFCRMLKAVKTYMPETSPLITILQAETYCHYASPNMVTGKDGLSITPLNAFAEVYLTLQGSGATASKGISPRADTKKKAVSDSSESEEDWELEFELEEKGGKKDKKDKKEKNNKKVDTKDNKGKSPRETQRQAEVAIAFGKLVLKKEDLMAMALTAMHLHLNCMSPLTTSQLQLNEPDFAEDTEYLDTYENSEYDSDPDTADGFDRTLSSSDFRVVNKNNPEVWDLTQRVEKLRDLYPRIVHPFYKAKAAYVLGHYYEGPGNDKAMAERVYFECIYLLDIAPPVAKGMFPIVSELGTNALMRYADIALHNSKYTYAILAYHAALTNYHLRNQKDAYYALLNQLGTEICPKNNDYARRLQYLEEMLFKYSSERKFNEMGNVLEWLSKQHMELGQHAMAEQYLQEWHQSFEENTYIDALRIRVVIEAAKMYIESAQLERAAQLLQCLLQLGSDLPTDKKNTVLELLSAVYIKKRWFVECSDTLDILVGTGSLRTPRISSRATTRDAGMRGISRDYWQLRASNYYHAQLLPEALVCIELAISSCDKSRLSALAKYYSLRGKILKALAAQPLVPYPTTFPASNLDNDTRNFLMQTKLQQIDPTLYTCVGDVIQEAIATFDKAYDYYLAVGDDTQLAKNLSRIAETYLNHLFGPVALLRFPYQERARLPAFKVSPLAARKNNTVSEEESNGGGSSKKQKKGGKEKEKEKSSSSSSSSSSKNDKSDSEEEEEEEDEEDEVNDIKDLFISFESIEDPALYALDLGAESCNILLMLNGYMNMAELRYLQDAILDSLTFWRECRDQLYVLFLDGPNLLLKSATPSFIDKLYTLVKRAVRFMLCFDSELINKNLMLLDAFLLLQMEREQAKKRPVYPPGTTPPREDPMQQIAKIIGKPKERKPTTIFPTFTSDKPGFSGEPSGRITISEPAKDVEGNDIHDSKEDVWGCLCAMKNLLTKYSEGKILQRELLRRNREMLGKIGRLQHLQRLQNHRRRTTAVSGGTLRRTTSRVAGSAIAPRPNVRAVNFGSSVVVNKQSLGSVIGSSGSVTVSDSTTDSAGSVIGGTGDPLLPAFGKTLGRNKSTFFRVQEKVSSLYTYQEVSGGSGTGAMGSMIGGSTIGSRAGGGAGGGGGAPLTRDGSGLLAGGGGSNSGIHREFMYILQVDDYMIFYVPSSGKKRIHRLGGKAFDSTALLSDKNSMIHLSVHLMADTSQSVTFAISPFTTLDTVLRQLCIPRTQPSSSPDTPQTSRSTPASERRDSTDKGAGDKSGGGSSSGGGSGGSGGSGESEGGSGNGVTLKRKKKFNSVSKMHTKITFLESTANFYAELSHWLEFFANKHLDVAASGGTASSSSGDRVASAAITSVSNPVIATGKTPPIRRGHRRSRSSSTSSASSGSANPLSFAFFAKKTATEHRSSSTFIPLTDRMKGTIYECFTAQELNAASPQKPLRLYVYFSDTSPTLSEISSSKTASVFGGSNRAISLTDNIIFYLTHLITPSSPKLEGYIPNPQAALNEMVDSVFSSLLEIAPSPSTREGSQTIPLELPSTKQNTTGFFSHLRRLTSSHELPERGSSKLYVSSNPLVLICSQSLQVFPWELLLGDLVVRSFSLHHLDRKTKPLGNFKEPQQLPKYLCFYQPIKEPKDKLALQLTEETQKDWLMEYTSHQLNLQPQAPFYSPKCVLMAPFQSSMIPKSSKLTTKTKRQKFVTYCELSEKALQEPSIVIKAAMAEADESHYPVCLFTYADLLDPHPMILSLLSKKNCTLLFIPSSYIKPFTKLLKRTFVRTSKTNPVQPNLYHALITSINTFQIKEKNFVPITIMNPPNPFVSART